ncbi:hypothetical protein GY03_18020 [Proteus vulgaris]|uniref:hypothetical protein n=1 Tax=Proteus vulgaris TaxID=585 RepID=UPI0021B09BC4|nr:hypothetical protein [Proteus vulgaris]MCT6519177.1 hypothetical protein [Proteus vulgaris]
MSLKEKLKQAQQNNDAKGAVIKQRLMTGYYGLAKLFWLFWFIPTMVFNFADAMSTSTGALLRIDTLSLVWSVCCLLFVSKTQGSNVWRVIAMIVIALDVALSAFALLTLF